MTLENIEYNCAKCESKITNNDYYIFSINKVLCKSCGDLYSLEINKLKHNFIKKLPDKDKIIKGASLILEGLGVQEKIKNEHKIHLEETPQRIAKGLIELCEGLFLEEPVVTTFNNTDSYNQLILVKNMEFVSICSHHFLTFEGNASIGYLPDKHLIGLSKIGRVLQYFSKRPQVQENLTEQIADFITNKINPKGVIVVLHARHSCMACRGVKMDSIMTTSAIRGIFTSDASAKEEALLLMK